MLNSRDKAQAIIDLVLANQEDREFLTRIIENTLQTIALRGYNKAIVLESHQKGLFDSSNLDTFIDYN